VAADGADPDAVAASVHAAVDHLGSLDVLVNNAGAGVTARLAGTSLADYDQVMTIKTCIRARLYQDSGCAPRYRIRARWFRCPHRPGRAATGKERRT
jgi:NAD(P)-dependent dehydrogenase (short-subunit alcohol dehydrogenase family)